MISYYRVYYDLELTDFTGLKYLFIYTPLSTFEISQLDLATFINTNQNKVSFKSILNENIYAIVRYIPYKNDIVLPIYHKSIFDVFLFPTPIKNKIPTYIESKSIKNMKPTVITKKLSDTIDPVAFDRFNDLVSLKSVLYTGIENYYKKIKFGSLILKQSNDLPVQSLSYKYRKQRDRYLGRYNLIDDNTTNILNIDSIHFSNSIISNHYSNVVYNFIPKLRSISKPVYDALTDNSKKATLIDFNTLTDITMCDFFNVGNNTRFNWYLSNTWCQHDTSTIPFVNKTLYDCNVRQIEYGFYYNETYYTYHANLLSIENQIFNLPIYTDPRNVEFGAPISTYYDFTGFNIFSLSDLSNIPWQYLSDSTYYSIVNKFHDFETSGRLELFSGENKEEAHKNIFIQDQPSDYTSYLFKRVNEINPSQLNSNPNGIRSGRYLFNINAYKGVVSKKSPLLPISTESYQNDYGLHYSIRYLTKESIEFLKSRDFSMTYDQFLNNLYDLTAIRYNQTFLVFRFQDIDRPYDMSRDTITFGKYLYTKYDITDQQLINFPDSTSVSCTQQRRAKDEGTAYLSASDTYSEKMVTTFSYIKQKNIDFSSFSFDLSCKIRCDLTPILEYYNPYSYCIDSSRMVNFKIDSTTAISTNDFSSIVSNFNEDFSYFMALDIANTCMCSVFDTFVERAQSMGSRYQYNRIDSIALSMFDISTTNGYVKNKTNIKVMEIYKDSYIADGKFTLNPTDGTGVHLITYNYCREQYISYGTYYIYLDLRQMLQNGSTTDTSHLVTTTTQYYDPRNYKAYTAGSFSTNPPANFDHIHSILMNTQSNQYAIYKAKSDISDAYNAVIINQYNIDINTQGIYRSTYQNQFLTSSIIGISSNVNFSSVKTDDVFHQYLQICQTFANMTPFDLCLVDNTNIYRKLSVLSTERSIDDTVDYKVKQITSSVAFPEFIIIKNKAVNKYNLDYTYRAYSGNDSTFKQDIVAASEFSYRYNEMQHQFLKNATKTYRMSDNTFVLIDLIKIYNINSDYIFYADSYDNFHDLYHNSQRKVRAFMYNDGTNTQIHQNAILDLLLTKQNFGIKGKILPFYDITNINIPTNKYYSEIAPIQNRIGGYIPDDSVVLKLYNDNIFINDLTRGDLSLSSDLTIDYTDSSGAYAGFNLGVPTILINDNTNVSDITTTFSALAKTNDFYHLGIYDFRKSITAAGKNLLYEKDYTASLHLDMSSMIISMIYNGNIDTNVINVLNTDTATNDIFFTRAPLYINSTISTFDEQSQEKLDATLSTQITKYVDNTIQSYIRPIYDDYTYEKSSAQPTYNQLNKYLMDRVSVSYNNVFNTQDLTNIESNINSAVINNTHSSIIYPVKSNAMERIRDFTSDILQISIDSSNGINVYIDYTNKDKAYITISYKSHIINAIYIDTTDINEYLPTTFSSSKVFHKLCCVTNSSELQTAFALIRNINKNPYGNMYIITSQDDDLVENIQNDILSTIE